MNCKSARISVTSILLMTALALPWLPALANDKPMPPEEIEALYHYDLAVQYDNNKQRALAEVELEAAIMHMPKLQIAHRDYCIDSLLDGAVLRSLAEFFVVIGFADPIPLNDQERMELTDKAAKAHYRAALKFGKELRWKDAIVELQYASGYKPDNAAIQRSLAFAYASDGNFDGAEKLYESSFAEDPKDPYSHADYAFLLSDKGQTEKAVAQLSEAVKINPNVAALHVDLGWLAESAGDVPSAEREFQSAIKLSPGHAALWSHLGRLLESDGKSTEAKRAYMQALTIDPRYEEAKQHLEHLKNV